MATFSTVVWQPDDEITSAKLQQMADNTQYIHDSSIQSPTVTYVASPSGAAGGMRGRPAAGTTVAATKLVGIFCTYDSTAPLVDMEVIVPIPVGFTFAPIFSVAVATGTLQEIAYISQDYSPVELRVHLFYRDGVARNFDGALHIMALGY